MRSTARHAERQLRMLADPARAAGVARFFKCGPGEYGEGDRFLGLTVPQVRTVAREFRSLRLPEVRTLLDSPWHEVRLVAVPVGASGPGTAVSLTRGHFRDLEVGVGDTVWLRLTPGASRIAVSAEG